MSTLRPPAQLESRATEALQALLGRVLGVTLKEIKRQPQTGDRAFDILADIDVYGHSHTLACKVNALTSPRHIRVALDDLCAHAAQVAAEAKPVLIAPCLSLEAQEMCKLAHAGFIDLEGNARLVLGDVFIGVRSHPCQSADRHKALAPHSDSRPMEPENLHHYSSEHAEVVLTA